MPSPEGCREATDAAGEPLVGSASRADRIVLVSWPKGDWPLKVLEAPAFAPVARWVADYDAARGGRTTVRLFATKRHPDGVTELRVFPNGRRAIVNDLAAAPETLSGLLDDPDRGEAVPRTLAVCTHGKYDRCCARYGQALFRTLGELTAERVDFEVVESSHLGGHRFAATCIDLPPNRPARMYGRLAQSDAPHLVRALATGTVWLDRYRGRCDLDPQSQAAEAEALAGGALDPIALEARGDDRCRARWAGGALEVALREVTFESPGACGDEPAPRRRWVVGRD